MLVGSKSAATVWLPCSITFQEQVADADETVRLTQPRILRPLTLNVTLPAILVVVAVMVIVFPFSIELENDKETVVAAVITVMASDEDVTDE